MDLFGGERMKTQMDLRRKTWIAVLLTAVLLACFFTVAFFQRGAMMTARDKYQNNQKLEDILRLMTMLESTYQESFDSLYNNKLRVNVRLTSAALRRIMEQDDLREGVMLEDGMLVFIRNGKVILPKGARADMLSLPDAFWLEEDEQKRFFYSDYAPQPDDRREEVLVVWDRVLDDAYYLSWTTRKELQKYVFTRGNETDILNFAEQIYGGYLLTVLDEGDGYVFVSLPALFSDCQYPEEIGFTASHLQNGDGQIDIQGTSYQYVTRTMESESGKDNMMAIFLTPADDQGSPHVRLALVLTIGALLIVAPALVWFASVQKTVMTEELDERRERSYCPYTVRCTLASVGAGGVILMFAAAAFLNTMVNLYEVSTESQTSSAALLTMMDMRSSWQDELRQDEKEWADYFARRIARLFGRYPDLITQDNLEAFSQILGGNYLMIFDADGNELLSSGPYKGFSLGTDPEDSSSDFRRLLMGVESIVHEPAVERVTEFFSTQAGARLSLRGGGYGAVILSAKADPDVKDEIERETDKLLNVLAPSDRLCLYVDRDSGVIEYASDESLKGVSAQYVGLRISGTALEGIDCFKINADRYYGIFREQDGKIGYYLSSAGAAGANTLRYALTASAMFLILYAAVVLWMLWDYREENFRAAQEAVERLHPHSDDENDLDSAILRYRQDANRRRLDIHAFWETQNPAYRAKLVFDCLLGLFLAACAVVFLVSGRNERFSLLAYLLKGEWSRGFNLFALASIFLLSAAIALGVAVLRALSQLFAGALGSLGETIWRLSLSLIEYIALLTLLFYSFGFLGVNTGALIGAVGLLTLALSLGAQNLVADVIAGITIVFEREYRVGDVVEINGFKGMVSEIGVRSTKLIGSGDNVKIICNRNIEEVLNMTSMNSWYPMELHIPGDQPLEEIEEMLVRELPKLKGKIDGVIGGPFYKGVLSIGEGGPLGGKNAATLSIIAEYREEDYLKVKRNMSRAIRKLFDKAGYSYY